MRIRLFQENGFLAEREQVLEILKIQVKLLCLIQVADCFQFSG